MARLRKRLGDMLLEEGLISPEELDIELIKQKGCGKRIGELLVEDGILAEEEILKVLEVQLNISRVNFEAMRVSQEAVNLISEALAIKYNLIPLFIENDRLYVAMSDPLNLFALDDVMIASGYEIEPMLAASQTIKLAIAKYYSKEFVNKAAEAITKERAIRESESQTNQTADEDEIKNAPVVKMVDSIIENAVRSRASDIHIEPYETYIRVRYRVDGELQETFRSPKETLGALTTRLKILANLNIAEKRIPQDGRIVITIDDSVVDLRVSVLPTVFGEKIVIRILSRNNFMVSKDKLGMSSDDLDKLSRIIHHTHGIMLVTGPTGSGKSTTLYTVLNELNQPGINIITVEDPVEYMMEGINQVNVNIKAGLTFASGLRSILRQDPDIIMIGEIRDGETAEIATRAAITGHLVLSTLHTNDSSTSVTRLIDMGIQPYLIATSICGIIAQRLVRKICENCKEGYEASDYEKILLKMDKHKPLKLYRGCGCNMCGGIGYRGRFGVYEIMEITKETREAIVTGRSTDHIKEIALSQGMHTINEACAKAVLNGKTTIEEFIRLAVDMD